MYELPDNKKYLVDVVLPKLQEIQRDTAVNRRLTLDVCMNVDCGLISSTALWYDENQKDIIECKNFSFYSHREQDEIDSEYNKLTDYVREHTA